MKYQNKKVLVKATPMRPKPFLTGIFMGLGWVWWIYAFWFWPVEPVFLISS